MRQIRRPPLALLLAVLGLLAGCVGGPGGAPARPSAGALPVLEVPHLEERALLLLMVDRQVYEPFTLRRALTGPPDLRRDLADALGRIGDPEGLGLLRALLADEQSEVRRAAIFALGVLNDAAAETDLLRVAAAGDRAEGVLAVEALGKLGTGLVPVLDALTPLAEEERWARLLPHLWRFRPSTEDDRARPEDSSGETARERSLSPGAFVAIAEQGLAVNTERPALASRAVYALARDPLPEALPALRRLATGPDPRTRAWVARALGRVGGPAEVPVLRDLLDDAEAAPIIHGLQSAHRLITGSGMPAPASWRPRLAELLADPRPGVRLTAIEVAALWVEAASDADDESAAAGAPTEGATVASRLLSLAASDLQRERQLAVLALAAAGHPEAPALVLEVAASPDAILRAAAATGAASLLAAEPSAESRRALDGILRSLEADEAPGVRIAALGARAGLVLPGELAPLLRKALEDDDAAVRAAALGRLATTPVIAFEEVVRALEGAEADRLPTARLSAVQALVARGEAEPLERGSVVKVLETLVAGEDFLLRRAAAEGLRALGRPAPAAGSLPQTRDVEVYRQIVQRTRHEREVEVRTERGVFRVRLACPRVPLTCLSFLQLAGQGFYEGLPFHRVVPDFVVQGGDPRGDGYGGPGYQLRDEISPLRYERGTIGMAHAGAHTAGSQFFVTLAPQPHLEGTYTAFGKVVAGGEVLDRIVQGVRILEMVVAD